MRRFISRVFVPSALAVTVMVPVLAAPARAQAGPTGAGPVGIARGASTTVPGTPGATASSTVPPAGGRPTTTTTTTTTSPATAAAAPARGLGAAPTPALAGPAPRGTLSLTAVLAKHQADGTGLDLSAYLRERGSELDSTLGTGEVFSSQAFSSMTGGAPTFESLNEQLVSRSFGNLGSASYPDLAVNLASSAQTPDGAAIAGGIELARQAGGLSLSVQPLSVPDLKAPGAPSVPALSMPDLGRAGTILSARPDELAFGLFANQSLARAVQSSPNLVAQVGSGQLSAESLSQFRSSMRATAADFSSGLGSSLPSPCYAGMMLGVASGSSAGARALGLPKECTPCITAGTYLSGRMTGLLTPGQFTSNPSDGNITPFEWKNLDPSRRQAIEQLNPDLARMMESPSSQPVAPATAAAACGQASAGTKNYLSGNLGSMLQRLGG